MANLVLALGTSHSPILALEAPDWETRARNDRTNQALVDLDGTVRTYDELAARVGDCHAPAAVPARWEAQAATAQRSLDRLAGELAQAAPDVVVIVGDDEHELFADANMPALSVFRGAQAVTRVFAHPDDPKTNDPAFAWMKMVSQMYGMDENRRFPVDTALARDMIERLIDAGFDVASSDAVPEPERLGFGHAFGFVVMRLLSGRTVPIVPVVLNTYFPPNQPTAARCYDLGTAIRAAVEAYPEPLRVALVASGGLSHFVTNEELDTTVRDALRHGEAGTLRAIPQKILNDGNSEIRCWLTLGGALGGLRHRWSEYVPVYRTPPGTGIGLGFGAWS